MSMARRFYLFGIGVAIGCVAVYLMLVRDRDFPNWSPEGRVRESILTGNLSLGDGILPSDTAQWTNTINNASVNFGQSDVRSGKCKTYILETETKQMEFRMCGKDVVFQAIRPK